MLFIVISALFVVVGLLVSIGIPALGIHLQHSERVGRDVTPNVAHRSYNGDIAEMRKAIADYEALVLAYRQIVQRDLETSGARR